MIYTHTHACVTHTYNVDNVRDRNPPARQQPCGHMLWSPGVSHSAGCVLGSHWLEGSGAWAQQRGQSEGLRAGPCNSSGRGNGLLHLRVQTQNLPVPLLHKRKLNLVGKKPSEMPQERGRGQGTFLVLCGPQDFLNIP